MEIIDMLNQHHILLDMVHFLPLTDTMVRDMCVLVLAILLEMTQLRLITMILVTTGLISQLLLILIVDRHLCMRGVANLPLLTGIIIDMDIMPLGRIKMLDMVIRLMLIVRSILVDHQYHQSIIFTSKVDTVITPVIINLMSQEAIIPGVVDGPLK